MRSPTRTWASVCSTKRFSRHEFEIVSFLLFPLPFIPLPPCGSLDDSLLYSILHDPCYEDLDHGEEKKKIAKDSNGQGHSMETGCSVYLRLECRGLSRSDAGLIPKLLLLPDY